MSHAELAHSHKVDLAYRMAYQNYQHDFHLSIAIHLIEILIMTIFLPIDLALLSPTIHIIIAVSLALGIALFSFLLLAVEYYHIFTKTGQLGFLQMARQLGHSTDQPITSFQTLDNLTSEQILHTTSGALVSGTDQAVKKLFAGLVMEEIISLVLQRYSQIRVWNFVYRFLSLGAMMAVIVLMAISDQLHAAQIVILIVYLLLQLYILLFFFLILVLLAVLPIVCVILLCWSCCCVEKDDGAAMVLDVQPRQATLQDVVNSEGDCSICLQSIKQQESIYQLPCSQKHIFHQFCLNQWVRIKKNCPICRAELPFRPGQHSEEPRIGSADQL